MTDKKRPAQCRLAGLIASERAPTNMRLKAQVASRLNQYGSAIACGTEDAASANLRVTGGHEPTRDRLRKHGEQQLKILPDRSGYIRPDQGFLHEFAADSPLKGRGFELVWGFSCQVVVLGFAESSLFGGVSR